MSAPPSHWLWEQHCCLPLHFNADITELARYPGGSYVSVNVGYSRQDKDQSSGLAIAFRQAALADGRFQAVNHLDDLAVARAEGLIALAFDLEDSRPLEGDLSNVAHFYDLGVRSLLPSYNHANSAGGGCLDADDTGLTAYGRDLIRELNAVGMFADGSHCSARTGLDVATTTTKPMIYSHSNFAGLWSHPRNITDDQARACAETGGVVGINGVGIFLGPNGSAQRAERLAAMVDHIEYGVDLIGVDHIGVGSDYSFDHVDFNAELRDNPSAFSEAYTAFGPLHWVPPEDTVGLGDLLATRGYDAAAIAKILGGNFARIAEKVWAG